KYPLYDLERNKGYGSPRHLLALQKYGLSPLHRRSFRPCQIPS
ncbi:MAG: ribonuclease HII, partial [Dolichospermum sp.]